jgi:hypothetical protein
MYYRRPRQEDDEFEARQGYKLRPCLKKMTTKKNQGVVAHICKPSYLRGRSYLEGSESSRPARAK